MTDKNKYQNENNELLQFILNNAFLDKGDINSTDYNIKKTNGYGIELMITSECNLGCKYCYIHNHGDELYPQNIRDHDDILKNIPVILKWCYGNGRHFNSIDLFSGEIWHTKFGIEVLDVVYDFLKSCRISNRVCIPSNMCFLLHDESTAAIQNCINKFKSIDVVLSFSASVEGKILESKFRPFNDPEADIRSDIFYDKLFAFCKSNHIGFHPMVSSKSCKYWKENYLWFEESFKKYNIDRKLMMLEVRNDDWSDGDIADYIDFVDWLIDRRLSEYNNDLELFHESLLNQEVGYEITSLTPTNNRIGCGIQFKLAFRVGDMGIIPCHRTCYSQFIYGYLKPDENSNVSLVANNPELALTILSMNPSVGHPGCDTCVYSSFCMKQCLGAEYEFMNDLFTPCNSVCKLYKTRIDFMIKKYEDLGLMDVIRKSYNSKAISMIAALDNFKKQREVIV